MEALWKLHAAEENVVMFLWLLGFENVGRESNYFENHLRKLQEDNEHICLTVTHV